MDLNIVDSRLLEKEEFHNVSYLLEEADLFLVSAYKIMKNQKKAGLAGCIRTLFNGKTKLVYFTEGKKSINGLYGMMNFSAFLSVVDKIMTIILEVKTNGFLFEGNLNLSFDRIFVDPNTLEVSLIYFPVSVVLQDATEMEQVFCENVLRYISSIPLYAGAEPAQVRKILSEKQLPFEEKHQRIRGVLVQKNSSPLVIPEEEYKSETHQFIPDLKLISQNTFSMPDFHIHKYNYVIGKSKDLTDGIIAHSTVSRQHCAISFENGVYYIEDLDSTNGTKVNKERIPSYQKREIKNGDIISIARCSFRVEC